jgi:nicotinamide-nucleotide amidase
MTTLGNRISRDIMPSAEIIAIGTELLLGEIQDSNTKYLANKLRNINIDLYRSTIIGDNVTRISELIKEALTRTDIIITSGGLGPTVDDPTREAVAQSVNSELVFLPELWEQIADRFKRYARNPSDNNRRQAYIPKIAIPVENPVGTAPAFIVELGSKCIVSLPGVPRELEFLMENSIIPYLSEKYQLRGVIKVCVLHTSGLGESLVDEKVADLELLSNPTVGLLAHPGQTDIRITAKADSEEEATTMISSMRSIIMARLGDHIYGSDSDTLEDSILPLIKNLTLEFYEAGFSSDFSEKLIRSSLSHIPLVSIEAAGKDDFYARLDLIPSDIEKILLGVYLNTQNHWPSTQIFVRINNQSFHLERSYGGPVQNAQIWAFHTALDYLRRILINKSQDSQKGDKEP